MSHKAGFVNIIGLPNTGKSTLMNALTGERLSIISPKAQTTRHRILGIVNAENYQVVFSDTPGFINQPAYKLQSSMNESVAGALQDADVLMLVTDKFEKEEEEKHLVELVAKGKTPSIVVINKMDLCEKKELEELVNLWKRKLPQSAVITISAASGINVRKMLKQIVELLPESPAYYEKDRLTDRNMRFFVSEMVREKIFLNYSAEIPYSCQVEVIEYLESETIDRLQCVIYVERESQKGILIGKNGAALKKTGTEARIEMEGFLGKKVHLQLLVKVKSKWRNDAVFLKNFGYIN